MIEKLLEAYEIEVVKDNSPLLKRIKRMKLGRKVILSINVVLIILVLILMIYKINTAFILSLVLIVVLDIETMILEGTRHRNWKENIDEYNLELNKIASILKRKEFNLYEKIKIKQLICKLYLKIDYDTQEDLHKKEEKRLFLIKYIIPVITFFVGKLNLLDLFSESSIIVLGISIVVIVYLVKYDYTQTVELLKVLKWNTAEKGKEFLPKLQDLLDRDFEIGPEDLISVK